MFDSLKSKIKSFFKKEEEVLAKKVEEAKPVEAAAPKPEAAPQPPAPVVQAEQPKPEEKKEEPVAVPEEEAKSVPKEEPKPVQKEEPKPEPKKEEKPPEPAKKPEAKAEPAKPPVPVPKPVEKPVVEKKPVQVEQPKPAPAAPAPVPAPITKTAPAAEPVFPKSEPLPEKKRGLIPKLSLATRIKKVLVRKATIKDVDVDGLLQDFNLSLLEADVTLPVAQKLCDDIKGRLVGKEITGSEDIQALFHSAMREGLLDVLKQQKIDLMERARKKKPFIILFVGPNGQGKTSMIAKLANHLKKQGMSCVISASDTFRAAAIEQIETLAGRVGIKVIKHKYGADPAAVAFDAIEHAKANSIDCVLIDTAGRSDLNINLMEQMKKIARVAKPDLKIYVGEALAGHAAVEEAMAFNNAIGIDGIIMTKVDCDVRGGSLLSVSNTIQKPILFIGTGQAMEDIQSFDPQWFVDRVMG
jgi:fused signal recognition particle receptor